MSVWWGFGGLLRDIMAEPETRRPSRNKDHVFIRGLGTVNKKITSIECHVYAGNNQTTKAIEAYQQAVRINPDSDKAWTQIGLACYHTKQYDTAKEAFQQVIRIKPNDTEAWWRLGFIYFLFGENENVERVYNRLKTLNPDMADEFNEVVEVVSP